MNTISASSIQNIVRLLDNGYMVYLHKPTGKVTAIPEFDGFADFEDSTNWEVDNIDRNPEEYIHVQGMNSREMYNLMMDFAQEQDELQVTKKLVDALRKSDGIGHFNDAIKQMPDVRFEWLEFRDERLQRFIKNKLMRKKQFN
ncbi:UPF0158 family protein [Carboxylicivirga caseinilyticus]|uniref:UPF0158 family protein n=1 Tax=Carboxylicivirga caseinilyticus TaxID=3417572 RepID=UPI002AA6F1BE|nr:UPF0158 family protein [uncultured Carboxylicivirga sp.]MCU4163567.1 hypothetical protein [Marinilabiliaceae bacterium A049]